MTVSSRKYVRRSLPVRVNLFLIDNICDEENDFYYLEVKKEGDLSYTSYRLTEDGVNESTWKMSEFYRDLLDEWNKKEMFMIGETDEGKKIVTHTGRQSTSVT